jgi:hypothetical protein
MVSCLQARAAPFQGFRRKGTFWNVHLLCTSSLHASLTMLPVDPRAPVLSSAPSLHASPITLPACARAPRTAHPPRSLHSKPAYLSPVHPPHCR